MQLLTDLLAVVPGSALGCRAALPMLSNAMSVVLQMETVLGASVLINHFAQAV